VTRYEIHTALEADANEGWVWIAPAKSDAALDDALKSGGHRPIVEIVGPTGKTVFVEARTVDTFYKRRWNEVTRQRQGVDPSVKPINFDSGALIFLNQWYRILLDVKRDKTAELSITPVKQSGLRARWIALYSYPRQHPQLVARSAGMLAIIGFALGLVGVGLAMVGAMLAVVGLVATITPHELATSGGTVVAIVLGILCLAFLVGGCWLLVKGILGLSWR
jgi:hypothetical protein